MHPSNLVITLMGVGLLWVGWFGFNAGSSVSSGLNTARALTVTPAAGVVMVPGAIFLGLVASLFSNAALTLKNRLGYDAPARGATEPPPPPIAVMRFQSTPPHGGRLEKMERLLAMHEFQSTPPHGGRLA